MKLLITSDVHGNLDLLKEVIHLHNNILFHINAGDMALPLKTYESYHIIAVKGNNDFGIDLPYMRLLDIEDKKILLTHGHHEHVKYGLERLSIKAKFHQVDICIFGHTHIPFSKMIDGILYINPGALSSGSYCIYENEKITFYQR